MKFEFNDVTKKYVCNECGKEYSKNGIGTHYWRMHTEQGSKFDSNIGFKNNTRQIWNKGLTKDDYLAKLDKNKIDLVNVQNNLNVYILTKDKINEEFIKKLPFSSAG